MISLTSCAGPAPDPNDFEALRKKMVAEQFNVSGRDVTDRRVLDALAQVPRHEFVPAGQRARAYDDRPLPIGFGQTISQPYVVGFMTQALKVKRTDKVLEIGTGSGYQAAVLARLVAEVYSIEIVKELAASAEATLRRLSITNVHVRAGDGYKGWAEAAPFDAVIVTCAPDKIPQPLIDQLKDGGRMVVPVGGDWTQELVLLQKSGAALRKENILPVRFVPMTGQAQERNPD